MTDRYRSSTDPVLTVWAHHSTGGFSGLSPANELEVVRLIELEGHAVLTDSRHARPVNHHVIGIGVGHDDARFAETGGAEGSMAAYYENGETFDGHRWWEGTSSPFSEGVKYYGCKPTHHDRIISKPTAAARAIRKQAVR